MRDSVSVAPPAGKPLTYRTPREGQLSWVKAIRGASSGVASEEPRMLSNLRRFTAVSDGIACLPSSVSQSGAAGQRGNLSLDQRMQCVDGGFTALDWNKEAYRLRRQNVCVGSNAMTL